MPPFPLPELGRHLAAPEHCPGLHAASQPHTSSAVPNCPTDKLSPILTAKPSPGAFGLGEQAKALQGPGPGCASLAQLSAETCPKPAEMERIQLKHELLACMPSVFTPG